MSESGSHDGPRSYPERAAWYLQRRRHCYASAQVSTSHPGTAGAAMLHACLRTLPEGGHLAAHSGSRRAQGRFGSRMEWLLHKAQRGTSRCVRNKVLHACRDDVVSGQVFWDGHTLPGDAVRDVLYAEWHTLHRARRACEQLLVEHVQHMRITFCPSAASDASGMRPDPHSTAHVPSTGTTRPCNSSSSAKRCCRRREGMPWQPPHLQALHTCRAHGSDQCWVLPAAFVHPRET